MPADLLWAQFEDSIDRDSSRSTGDERPRFVRINIPFSVSAVDFYGVSRDQIDIYYNLELGPKLGRYLGCFVIELEQLQKICSDFGESESGRKRGTQEIKVPNKLKAISKPCECSKNYTLYNSADETIEFERCLYNNEQEHCPVECRSSKSQFGFCPRNPAHHNIVDSDNPLKQYGSRTLLQFIGSRIRTDFTFEPFANSRE